MGGRCDQESGRVPVGARGLPRNMRQRRHGCAAAEHSRTTALSPSRGPWDPALGCGNIEGERGGGGGVRGQTLGPDPLSSPKMWVSVGTSLGRGGGGRRSQCGGARALFTNGSPLPPPPHSPNRI